MFVFNPSNWLLSVQASVLWSHPVISALPHYQMVRLTPAQIERLIPCAARTSSQCSLVFGISSSGSGSDRAPFLGLATTTGSGPRCDWNSTTWSCFLSACVWWVSCQTEDEWVVWWLLSSAYHSSDLHLSHRLRANMTSPDWLVQWRALWWCWGGWRILLLCSTCPECRWACTEWWRPGGSANHIL